MGFLGLPIVGDIIGAASGAIQDWQKRKTAKVEAETAVIKAEGEAKARILEKAVDNEAAWDMLVAGQMSTSWKDEYWTIVLSIPLVMSFVPTLAPFVHAGFQSLSAVPEWYFYCVMTAVAGAFGLRALTRLSKK